MDDQIPEDAAKLAALPRQSAMPCVCVADGRQQMRTFLAETLEDLGCVTCECVDVAELSAELGTRPPDLVVIGSSAGGIEACEMVELLAAKEFGGKDRKSTRLNSSHLGISYAVFCLKKKNRV